MGLANFQKALEFFPLIFMVLRILLFSQLFATIKARIFSCLRCFKSSVIAPIRFSLSPGNNPGTPKSSNLSFSFAFIFPWISTTFGGNLGCLGDDEISLEDAVRALFVAEDILSSFDTAQFLCSSPFAFCSRCAVARLS